MNAIPTSAVDHAGQEPVRSETIRADTAGNLPRGVRVIKQRKQQYRLRIRKRLFFLQLWSNDVPAVLVQIKQE